ncbi:MAG: 3-methyl-2-oxobutanoate hydroxymethyltransferase [Sporomusaceae bacterium]|nr:3-methyl-2-oxobutanoate hydroxymethyltransferase [Sporomusaceae bacterium]
MRRITVEKRKVTIPQLREMKQQGKRFKMVTAYDYPLASVIDKSSIEVILVGDSLGMVVLGYDSTVSVTMEDMLHHIKPVVRGAPNTLVVADMPFGSYNVSISEAISNANRMMKEGRADCVKLEGGSTVIDTVRGIVNAGIPVMGHIGLTPQTVSQLGGFKVQGKDAEAALKLLEDAQKLEEAGAFAIVVECVPAPVAKLITEKLSIPVVGIGAGPDCDGQVLVAQDMLGMFDRFVPKFVKQYANLNGLIMEALEQYAAEVDNGEFPGPEHSFGMKEEVLKKLY